MSSKKPNHTFEIENTDYLVKIASDANEIQRAQKLRHLTFIEQGLGKQREGGLDLDEYDNYADHLIIIDKIKNELIGTYRLIHSDFSDKFYSQTEFILDDFLKAPGSKLEMGRACTHPDYRDGRTMDLLWQGLSKYITISKTQFLFGCSTVKTNNEQYMFSLHKALSEKDKIKNIYNIKPTPSFYWPNSEELAKASEAMPAFNKELPPLLRSYLHAGSFVHGLPAFDVDFDCYDLFTILNLNNLNSKFKARYKIGNQTI